MIRNGDGANVLARYTLDQENRSIKEMEAMAILEALRHLQNLEKIPTYLETDSLEVARLIRQEDLDLTKICWLVDEIHNLMESKSVCFNPKK